MQLREVMIPVIQEIPTGTTRDLLCQTGIIMIGKLSIQHLLYTYKVVEYCLCEGYNIAVNDSKINH